jgi:chromosome segregation ATPase
LIRHGPSSLTNNDSDGLERRVADIDDLEAELHSRLDELNNEETELHVQKGQEAINYMRTIEMIRTQHAKMVIAAIQYIEAQSDFEELSRHSTDALQLQIQKDQEFKDADALVKSLGARYKANMDKVGRLFLHDTELADYWESISEEAKIRTPDELAAEIEALTARLELLQEGDPTMIRTFEDRARNIERLQAKVAENDDGLQELDQAMTEIRSRWEPKLDELIDKISEAFGASFQKINCNSEVIILKPGQDGRDFENWAIQPRMSFREGEPLQALDSHRQSGGERAVSTIFYLMALQTLSRAPFRVVDEINQGMDPRNERIVHERMVDIACGNTLMQRPEQDGESLATSDMQSTGGKLSQYFLITPKLLNRLKYAHGMTVHCIASGEYMPDQKEGATTFAGYLKQKQAINRARAVAVA